MEKVERALTEKCVNLCEGRFGYLWHGVTDVADKIEITCVKAMVVTCKRYPNQHGWKSQ